MAMDGRYAGNAGAFSGGCISAHYPEKRSAAAWDTLVRRKCRSIFRRVHICALSRKTKCRWVGYDGTPEMQEHFPAGAYARTIPKIEALAIVCTPKMQDAIIGGCVAAHYPEKRRA